MIIGFPDRFVSAGAISAMLALAAFTVTPAIADSVTFAQYDQFDGATQQWTVSTGGSPTTTTISASGLVEFTFSEVPGLNFSGPQLATFNLSVTSTQIGTCQADCGAGDTLTQFGYSGTFSFTDDVMGSSDYGMNLLSGTLAVTGTPWSTGGQYTGNVGSTSGSLDASATAGNLSQLLMTSDFINFIGHTDADSSFSLSSLVPDFSTGLVNADMQAYPGAGPFTVAGSGTFSSDAPMLTPEPTTFWLIGAGLSALVLKRRKRIPAAIGPSE
jgi:hypothetical protein